MHSIGSGTAEDESNAIGRVRERERGLYPIYQVPFDGPELDPTLYSTDLHSIGRRPAFSVNLSHSLQS